MSLITPPQFNRAHRFQSSPYCAPPAPGAASDSDRSGGFMIASASSMRRWHVVDTVRSCLYGEVLRAVEVEHGGYFAIKQMSLERVSSTMRACKSSEDPLKEIATLQFLKAHGPHPNVIEVIETLQDAEYIYVVLPFCGGGELFSLVSTNRGLSEDASRPIFRGLLDGVAFLHSLQICHRDISLENILLTDDGRVKIIDFGMALKFGQTPGPRDGETNPPNSSCVSGTSSASGGGSSSSARSIPTAGPFGKRPYMPPEVAMNEREYDGFAVDIWACGVVMFITLAGVPPFRLPIPAEDYRCGFIAVEKRLLELVRRWNLPLSSELVSLIQSCLLFDPGERSNADELRSHSWLSL